MESACRAIPQIFGGCPTRAPHPRPLAGLLQRFVPPKGARNSAIRSAWAMGGEFSLRA